MSKVVGIYKITSPNDRIYVGLSSDIYSRWETYKYPCNIKVQKLLYNSFIKYGVDSHKFEIIEEVEDESLLPNKEIYWISHYDCYNTKHGLNLSVGGNKPPVQDKPKSKEHKQKIREALVGSKHSEETKEKIRQKRKSQVIPKEIYEANAIKKQKSCVLINKNDNTIIKANSRKEMIKLSKLSSAYLNKLKNKENKKYKFYYE
jgi:group I intron endonuclease